MKGKQTAGLALKRAVAGVAPSGTVLRAAGHVHSADAPGAVVRMVTTDALALVEIAGIVGNDAAHLEAWQPVVADGPEAAVSRAHGRF